MILYKKDTKGKIRQLDIFAQDWKLIQISWLVWGKQVRHIKECTEKNVWKSSHTSREKQAKLEAIALIKKKSKEGYFVSQKSAESEEVILPMLAKSYEKEATKINWEGDVFVQPKLDGMRALAFCDGEDVKLMSRKGIEIVTMPHIVKELKALMLSWMILDWELYAHWISFQENMKLIKKNREGSINVHFHIYDMVDSWSFKERKETVDEILETQEFAHLLSVETYYLSSYEELLIHHKGFLEQWYEWTMLRHWTDSYKKNGRSSQLLKVKDFIDETFNVVDVVPMEVYTDQGIIVCEMENWYTFKATPKMSHKEKKLLLKNKTSYIWQTAEIRFFEWTDEGVPRFPICVGFRLDK